MKETNYINSDILFDALFGYDGILPAEERLDASKRVLDAIWEFDSHDNICVFESYGVLIIAISYDFMTEDSLVTKKAEKTDKLLREIWNIRGESSCFHWLYDIMLLFVVPTTNIA